MYNSSVTVTCPDTGMTVRLGPVSHELLRSGEFAFDCGCGQRHVLPRDTTPPPETKEATGTVLHWYAEEGWGVLVSPDVEGTVFAHFSTIDLPGYRELHEGQPVRFSYTTPGQDGCDYRAQFVQTLA